MRIPKLAGGVILLCAAFAQPSSGAETCRFAGTTDYDGHVAVTTTEAAAGGTVRLDVAVRFEATTAFWLRLRYLVEEISEWRGGALLRLDANTRYVLAGRIVRQQWDDFQATPEGLQAHRVQGKRPVPFAQQFPRFAQHWELGAFGRNWLSDFALAAPERRPDLDLRRVPEPVQSPFALAFYWVRFLHPGAHSIKVFLPGFKADKLADVALTPVARANGTVWHAGLHHAYLSAAPPSIATAQISADGHLQRLTFELHGPAGSASGTLHLVSCSVSGQVPDP